MATSSRASVQTNDVRGTAAGDIRPDFGTLGPLARRYGVDEEKFITIGIKLWLGESNNEQEEPGVYLSFLALARGDVDVPGDYNAVASYLKRTALPTVYQFAVPGNRATRDFVGCFKRLEVKLFGFAWHDADPPEYNVKIVDLPKG